MKNEKGKKEDFEEIGLVVLDGKNWYFCSIKIYFLNLNLYDLME